MVVAASQQPTSLSWVLLLAAFAIGIAAGHAAGGRLSRLSIPTGVVIGLLVLLGIQVGASWLPKDLFGGAARFVVLAVTYVAVAAGLVVALRSARRGRISWLALASVVLMLSGLALNGIAIAANGRMPVSRTALRAAGYTSDADPSKLGRSVKHVVATRDTVLLPLGDVIPIPPLHAVYSAGDFLLLAGIATFLAAGMTGGFTRRKEQRGSECAVVSS
jgi:hypothetical protein